MLPTLTDEGRARLVKHATNNTDAYRAYTLGRYFWSKRTARGLARSIECFQEAIKEDPNFALAYAGLADCHATHTVISDVHPTEAFPNARAAAAAMIFAQLRMRSP